MSKFSEPSSPYKNAHRYFTPEEFENQTAKLSIGYNKAEQKFQGKFEDILTDLQANILLFHRKDFSQFYFLQFKNEERHLRTAHQWIQDIAHHITSAKEQFADRNKPICCFYLTWEGYRTLGLEHLAPFLDNNMAFAQGMRKRVGFPVPTIEKGEGEVEEFYDKHLYPNADIKDTSIHAMLMIASDKPDFSNVDNSLILGLNSLLKGTEAAKAAKATKEKAKEEAIKASEQTKKAEEEAETTKKVAKGAEDSAAAIAAVNPDVAVGAKAVAEGLAKVAKEKEAAAEAARAAEKMANEKAKEIGTAAGDEIWAYVTKQEGLIKKRLFELGEKKEKKEKIVEWFGFRDGVSQPLFFPDARPGEAEIKNFDGDDVAPLRIVLTKDRGGQSQYSAGSFLAFLKLEQDVPTFQKNVKNIALRTTGKVKDKDDISEDDLALAISKSDLELARAYIMGRFRDGTSVSLSERAKELIGPPANDFQYSKIHFSNADSNVSDEKGIRCPFAAHARKANPRDDKEAIFIVRRGVLYDDEDKELGGVMNEELIKKKTTWEEWKEGEEPKGKGLLFMSFQSSLDKQFEHILNEWMLSGNTGTQKTGVDLLMGTGVNHGLSEWYLPREWGEEDPNKKIRFTPKEIKPCVHFKGGEYFFAPSISFLKKVTTNNLIFEGNPKVDSTESKRFKVPRLQNYKKA